MPRISPQSEASETRKQVTEALLLAAERLLSEGSYANVTTRRVAQKAGVKYGLVHYYFGSMEELLVQTLERVADRLVEPLAELYADPDRPFNEKWRRGRELYFEPSHVNFPKILLELSALCWNQPSMRPRISDVHARFRTILEPSIRDAVQTYGLEHPYFPPPVVITLLMSSQLGFVVEQVSGVEADHAEVLESIQRWLDSLEAQRARTAG